MISYTTEILFHFSCSDCNKWWSIGDHQVNGLPKELTCPHCGSKSPIETRPIPSTAESKESDQQDLERYRWLESQAKEVLLRPTTLNSIMPDLRSKWEIPTLICSGPLGGFLKFGEAIDVLMDHK